jgi:hypothetical protein
MGMKKQSVNKLANKAYLIIGDLQPENQASGLPKA